MLATNSRLSKSLNFLPKLRPGALATRLLIKESVYNSTKFDDFSILTQKNYFARIEKEPVKNERSTIFGQDHNINTTVPMRKALIGSFLEFYLFLIIAVIF